MGERDAGVEIDNTGGALQRMGRSHASLKLIAGLRITLKGEQTRRQYLGLAFRFQAEQILSKAG